MPDRKVPIPWWRLLSPLEEDAQGLLEKYTGISSYPWEKPHIRRLQPFTPPEELTPPRRVRPTAAPPPPQRRPGFFELLPRPSAPPAGAGLLERIGQRLHPKRPLEAMGLEKARQAAEDIITKTVGLTEEDKAQLRKITEEIGFTAQFVPQLFPGAGMVIRGKGIVPPGKPIKPSLKAKAVSKAEIEIGDIITTKIKPMGVPPTIGQVVGEGILGRGAAESPAWKIRTGPGPEGITAIHKDFSRLLTKGPQKAKPPVPRVKPAVPGAAPEAVAPAAKEPWQMTMDEWKSGFVKDWREAERQQGIKGIGPLGRAHKDRVRKALAEGKPVPPEVLKDYPELAKAIPRREAIDIIKKQLAKAEQERLTQAEAEAKIGLSYEEVARSEVAKGLIDEASPVPSWAQTSRAYDAEAKPYAKEWLKTIRRHQKFKGDLEAVWYGANNVAIRGNEDTGTFLSEVLGRQVEPYREGYRITAEEAEWLGIRRSAAPPTEAVVPAEKLIAPEAVAPAVAKEPWQMTRAEFMKGLPKAREAIEPLSKVEASILNKELGRRVYKAGDLPNPAANEFLNAMPGYGGGIGARELASNSHFGQVREALSQGKPVPPEVLRDYPDLAKAIPKAEAVAPGLPPADSVEYIQGRLDVAQRELARLKLAAKGEVSEIGPIHQQLLETNKRVKGLALRLNALKKIVAPPKPLTPAPVGRAKVAEVAPKPPAEPAIVPPSLPLGAVVPKVPKAGPPPARPTAMPPVKPPRVGGKPPPSPPGGGPPSGAIPPVAPSGVREQLAQASAIVARDRPATIGRVIDLVPGLKQIRRGLQPGIKLPDNILTGWVGEGNARATVGSSLTLQRQRQLQLLEAAFGKKATTTRDFKPSGIKFRGTPEQAQYPYIGTLADIMSRPSLYELSAEQRTLLQGIQEARSGNFQKVREAFNLDIGEFPVEAGGVHLPNVDVSESALETSGSLQTALRRGRVKERFYATAADRWAHDKTFRPETTIASLLEANDNTLAQMAGKEVFMAGAGGKTRLEVLQETHPALAKKMEALRGRLNSLRSSQTRLEARQDQAIQDFLSSPVEDADLVELQAALDVALQRGPRMGMRLPEVGKEIVGIKAQIAALRPAWRVANLKPYVFVQEGIFRYFKASEAKQLRQLLQTSSNRFLSFVDQLRATAFGGDLSPISIQGLTAWLSDPVGVSRQVVSGKAGITLEAMMADMRASPESWKRFMMATGIDPLGSVTQEFAVGLPGKLPKVGKFWTAWNEALYRPITRIQKGVFDTSYAAALKKGLTSEQAAAIAGDDASKIVPRISYRRLGQSEAQAAQQRAALTSVSFLTQPTALVADATTGLVKLGLRKPLTPSEEFAVRRVITIVGAVEAIAVSSHAYYAQTHDLSVEAAVKDSLTPDSGWFMSLVLPNGRRVGLGGPFRSLIRGIAPGKVEGVPIPLPFARIHRFALSKLHPTMRIIYDEIRNVDFFGKRIRTGDFPLNILQGVGYVLEGSMPLTLGSAAGAVRRGETRGEVIEEIVSQFAGVSAIRLSVYQKVQDWAKANRLRSGASIERYNAIPSNDREAKAGYEIEGKRKTQTRDEYRRAHPIIYAMLFIMGKVTSFEGTDEQKAMAKLAAVRIMKKAGIGVKDIESLKEDPWETPEHKSLRRYFERVFRTPAK